MTLWGAWRSPRRLLKELRRNQNEPNDREFFTRPLIFHGTITNGEKHIMPQRRRLGAFPISIRIVVMLVAVITIFSASRAGAQADYFNSGGNPYGAPHPSRRTGLQATHPSPGQDVYCQDING